MTQTADSIQKELRQEEVPRPLGVNKNAKHKINPPD
jgi:hypothetical protein